jgi:DNA-binding NtrC family response regulator
MERERVTHRILIADDEPLYLRTTGDLLRKSGYECVCVPDAKQATAALREGDFDLVLSDLNMPGNLKLELLKDHSRLRKHIPLIVITGVPSLPTAIESIRLGIADYLMKPVKFEDLLRSVERAIEHAGQTSRAAEIPTRPRSELQRLFPELIGASSPMIELFEIIDRIAGTDTNILITGESGTGKEVVARTIHQHSYRSEGAYQVIDCTAVPESLFESMLFGHKKGSFTGAVSDQAGLLKQCDGGTAFFDELGELPMPMQAKLLRAVQEQTFFPVGSHTPVTVDTRFICATNRDLQSEVNAGRFRQDLFYRLGVIHVELPPLRKRGDDVLLLANHFLKLLTKNHSQIDGFADATLELLKAYPWPGNIRELRNVIERSVALSRGNLIEPTDLPENIRCDSPASGSSRKADGFEVSPTEATQNLPGLATTPKGVSREEALKVAEYQYLVTLLQTHGGNVSEAARQAGLSRQGLHKLLKQHDIYAADYRR